MAGPIRISILANASQAKKEINGVGKSAESGVSKAKSALKGLAAGFLGFEALHVVTDVLKGSVEQAREAQKTGAQTTAVIKSTGGAANVSAKHVHEYADAIARSTGINADSIQQNENLLLTFKGVRNEVGKGNSVFDRATQTVTNMSVSLKESGKAASIQLGKALNDPIKGITALSRVGVTFTDQQKKQITAMVGSGHAMGAQKIILKELGSEFGGSAAAQATAGDRMKETFRQVEEEIGTKMLPILDKVETYVAKNLPDWMAKGEAGVDKLHDGFVKIEPTIESVLGFLRDNKSTVLDIALAVGTFAVAMSIGNKAVTAGKAVMAAYKAVQAVFVTSTEAQTVAQGELDAAMDANPIGLVVIAIAALAAGFVFAYKRSSTFRTIVNTTFDAVKVGISLAWKVIGPIFKLWVLEVEAVIAIFRFLWNDVVEPVLKFIIKGLGVLMGAWASMLRGLSHVPGFGWAKDAANVMQGAADKANGIADALHRIPKTTSTTVVLNVVEGIVHTTGGHVPGDPSQPTSRSVLNSGTSKPTSKTYNINVTAPVGSDPYTIGEGLRTYLDAYEQAAS